MTTNQIHKNMLSQIDFQGNNFLLIKEINDHRKNEYEINSDSGFLMSKSGNIHAKKTARVCNLQVECNGGYSKWATLVYLKHYNPTEIAEYAVSKQLQEEPEFKWWVNYVLCRRYWTISKVKAKYWQKSHNLGIRIPKTVKEALDIHKATGTNFW